MVGVSFESEFNTIINQFNAKVKQLRNQGLKYLPDEVDKEYIRQTYQYDEKALKRKLEDLQKFTEKGAEKIITVDGGAKITKWEYESIKREAQVNKSYLTREIKRYGNIVPTIGGKKQARNYAQMGDATYENLIKTRESLDKSKFETQQDLKRYKTKIKNLTKRRMTQDYVFKESYIEFIKVAGQKAGFDEDRINELVNKMQQMDAHEFYDIYQEEKKMQDIKDKYNTTKIINGNFTDADVEMLSGDFDYLSGILDIYVEVK